MVSEDTYSLEEVRIVLHRVVMDFFVVLAQNVDSKLVVHSLSIERLESRQDDADSITSIQISVLLHTCQKT
jgi:hypothetical protein